MQKKIPLRMCVVCRQMHGKNDLIRIVKNNTGDIFVDSTFKASGRGAYICKSAECLERCAKTKILNKAFKCEVDEAIIRNILI